MPRTPGKCLLLTPHSPIFLLPAMGAIVDVFRVLATLMNTIMYLSPVPSVREIYRNKTTGHTPFLPLVAMIANSYSWMMYGYLTGNIVAIFSTCLFGVIMALIYVSIHYRYATDRCCAHRTLAFFAMVIALLTAYIVVGLCGYTNQSQASVGDVVGYFSIIMSVIMYSSPLEKIGLVFKHRSGSFIPIDIVVVGCVNSASWVLYSLFTADWLVFAPNVFLLAIGLAQIAVYMAFRPPKQPAESAQLEEGSAADASGKDLEMSLDMVPSPEQKDKTEALNDAPITGFVPLRSPLAPLNFA